MPLDEYQFAAANHFKGPAMILAGPGSGKTTVITHRIQNLIEQYNVPPETILVITFTKMAAVEMKTRFLKMCDNDTTNVTFGTFHAVFFMILKNVYNYNFTDIIKLGEQRDFIKTKLMMLPTLPPDEQAFISDTLSEIAKVKSLGIDLENYVSVNCEPHIFRQLYNSYQDMLRADRRLDFEDMMIKTLEVLNSRKDILALWQNKYQFILIDEFQDASPVQLEVVKLLAAAHNNIFVVGDDDQSIYGFRGAAPQVMQDFSKVYTDAKIYNLNINYRSACNIVTNAVSVINHNKNRFYKDLRAFSTEMAEIKVLSFENISEECTYIAEEIVKNKVNTAVLTRTNLGADKLIKKLMQTGIKVKVSGKKDSIFNHWITQDIIAYVRIATGSFDRADYLRIINKPIRYIDRIIFNEPRVNISNIRNMLIELDRKNVLLNFDKLVEDIETIKSLSPFAGINYIRKKIGYDSYIRYYAASQHSDAGSCIQVLDELTESMRQCFTYKQWLEQIKLSEAATENANFQNDKINNKNDKNNINNSNQSEDYVTFSTMHSAKGLEFDTVYIIDANEGITPYSKAVTAEQLEEERRLFYVAMTRAKKRLVICHVKERYNKKMQPSRYIKELNCDLSG